MKITIHNYFQHKPNRAQLDEAMQGGYDTMEDIGPADLTAMYEDPNIREMIDLYLAELNEQEKPAVVKASGQRAAGKPKGGGRAASAPKSQAAPTASGGEPSPPRWNGPPAVFRQGERVRVLPVPAGSWIIMAHQQENAGREATISKVLFDKDKTGSFGKYKTTYHVSYLLDFGDGKGSHRYKADMLERVSQMPDPAPARAPKRAARARLSAAEKGRAQRVKQRQAKNPKPSVAPEPKFKRGERVTETRNGDHGTVLSVQWETGRSVYEYTINTDSGHKHTFVESALVAGPEKEAKARKKTAPKPDAEKPAKQPKARKAPEPEPQGVRLLDPTVKFIRAYVALNGKAVLVKRAVNQLRAIQRAALEQRIRKSDRFADEVTGIQASLLKLANAHRENETVTVEIAPADDLAKLIAIAGGERTYPSVAALKSLVTLKGREPEKKQLESLLKRLEKVGKTDPLYGEAQDAAQLVKRHIKRGGKLDFYEMGLSGLTGDYVTSLMGSIDRHTEHRHGKKPCGCAGKKKGRGLSGCNCK